MDHAPTWLAAAIAAAGSLVNLTILGLLISYLRGDVERVGVSVTRAHARIDETGEQLREIGDGVAELRGGAEGVKRIAEATALLQKFYQEPIKEKLVGQRIQEIKKGGAMAAVSAIPQRAEHYAALAQEAGVDIFVVQATVITRKYDSSKGAMLDFGKLRKALKVPLIIGSNQEEMKVFLYLAGSPSWRSPEYQAAARFGSERWKAEAVDAVARQLSAVPEQPPVYAYLFGWGARDQQGDSPLPGHWGERLGSFHSLEIPFFLGVETTEGSLVGTMMFTRANRPGRVALASAMQRYLVSFLRSGDPNLESSAGAGALLPFWAPWSNAAGAPKCILFDTRGPEAEIRLLDRELTLEGIEAAMRAELSPELLETTRAILARPLTGPTRRR